MAKEQEVKRKCAGKSDKGITLIALIITIVVLIIIAGIAVSMTVGDNGIFAKAKETKRLQITSEAKEKIGAEILDAQVEAIERNEELEQAQVEDIISKYGTLQDDKDTIILKDNGYEISLLDIYQGTITTSGSYTENKAKIELLEGQVKRLQEQLDSMSQTGDEKDKTIADLNDKVTTIENEKNELQNKNNSLTSKATELTNLKETLSKVTATEGQILKDYTAYKDGKLITGTMANYAGTTQNATSTSDDTYTYLTIPNNGYYTTASKLRTSNSGLGKKVLSGLLMVKSEKIIRTSGIIDSTLNKSSTAIQIDRAWFGSGCRNVSMNYKYSINSDNNIEVSASNSDFANTPFIYTIGTNCTLVASEIKSTESSGTNSSYNFTSQSLPDDLNSKNIIVELINTVIGSGQSDKLIYFTYSYNASTKTVTVTPSISVWTNANWIANIYKIN